MSRLTFDDFRSGYTRAPWWSRLFDGYNFVTWLVVFNLGCTGLLVSWVMKYADNVVKVYSTSMAMLLTTMVSVYLFSFVPTLQLFLGILICGMSLQMYFTPAHMLVDLPASQPKGSSDSLTSIAVPKHTGAG